MSTPSPIDPTVLDQICEDTGGDGAFVIEIIDEFIADSRARLAAFAEALAAGDACAAGDAVHSLKGASESVGSRSLADLAMAAERACRDGAVTVASEHVPQLEAAWALTVSALVAEKQRFGTGQ